MGMCMYLGAADDINLSGCHRRRQRAARRRHIGQARPGLLIEIEHPCFILGIPAALAAVGISKTAENIHAATYARRGSVVYRYRIGRQFAPLTSGGIEAPEYSH